MVILENYNKIYKIKVEIGMIIYEGKFFCKGRGT